MEKECFIAIRKTDGRYWMDISSLDLLPSNVKEKVKDLDSNIPLWSKDNKFCGIVEVKLSISKSIKDLEKEFWNI